jgi:hypothetical protein
VKRYLSISLLLLILFPTLSKLWVYVDFKIRQEQIAGELCAYRDVPLVMCNGICYLEDQLQKTELPGQEKIPFSVQKLLDFQLVFQILLENQLPGDLSGYSKNVNWYYLEHLPDLSPDIILPPPRLI